MITDRMGGSTSAPLRTGSVLRRRPGFFSLSLVRSYLDDLDDADDVNDLDDYGENVNDNDGNGVLTLKRGFSLKRVVRFHLFKV